MEHENNYHENFNEINREVTFAAIWDWMQKYSG
jgi:alpha-beta hydrolase superfamily lysophospholipase